MPTGKYCKVCNVFKTFESFSARTSKCKPCTAAYVREYNKTLPGCVTRIYGSERCASKPRKHPAPAYTKKELSTWLYKNGLEALFTAWKNSGFKKELVPSVDRLNSTLPYTLDNIRLVTWKENNDAAYRERKSCKRVTAQCKEIQQLTPTGDVVGTHKSIAIAARNTGFCRTNINFVCRGKRELAHGYRWQYANLVINELLTSCRDGKAAFSKPDKSV
jgi:hypothetical protein